MGYAEETQVAQAVAHQRGLEYLSLGKDSINRDAARIVSARLAEKHLCIPVREEDGELVVAMENPLDLIAIEDVERASERRVRPAVATPTAILAAIATVYTPERQRA
jgi:type IV pilus assembly protein PilB